MVLNCYDGGVRGQKNKNVSGALEVDGGRNGGHKLEMSCWCW